MAFDGVRFLDVVGPLEVFTVANEQSDHYVASRATLGGRDVVTTTGNRLGADALEDLGAGDIDTLLVAGTPNWHLLWRPSRRPGGSPGAAEPARRLGVHGHVCAGRRRASSTAGEPRPTGGMLRPWPGVPARASTPRPCSCVTATCSPPPASPRASTWRSASSRTTWAPTSPAPPPRFSSSSSSAPAANRSSASGPRLRQS